MTAMLVILGWFAADAALTLIAGDSEIRPTFAEQWTKWVYRGAYILAAIFFGIAFGRFVFRKIEETGTRLEQMSARDKVALAGGLAVGILLSAIVSLPIIFTLSAKSMPLAIVLSLLLGVIITYLAVAAGWSLKEEIRFYIPPKETADETMVPDERFKLLDTNVIIDGRVADVARAGFIEGHLYVPGFVLDELQYIADSADALKRARGRRGLDTLRQMQLDLKLSVREYDKLAPGKDAVDSRLVRLAKVMNGSIVTNDFNLNKVAGLEGVSVLNINELANCLKTVVLPGEEMNVTIVKHGREAGQGVGYLDDGTMVVVENARRKMGETLPVLVQSVMQTQAGKMVFAHIADEEDEGTGDPVPDDDGGDPPRTTPAANGAYVNGNTNGRQNNAESVRAYTGGRTRRPVR
ncbi:MAG: TRAM domain-containing protein [Akkermansiaceae bacterium]|nr:TRAM domain-containing protein [Armatimonadota bacterium]